MVTWKIKNCPRCGGDMYIDLELDGWYEQCLQCGYVHDSPRRSKPTSTVVLIKGRRNCPGYIGKVTPETDAVFEL